MVITRDIQDIPTYTHIYIYIHLTDTTANIISYSSTPHRFHSASSRVSPLIIRIAYPASKRSNSLERLNDPLAYATVTITTLLRSTSIGRQIDKMQRKIIIATNRAISNSCIKLSARLCRLLVQQSDMC
jgi:hypothetical protein